MLLLFVENRGKSSGVDKTVANILPAEHARACRTPRFVTILNCRHLPLLGIGQLSLDILVAFRYFPLHRVFFVTHPISTVPGPPKSVRFLLRRTARPKRVSRRRILPVDHYRCCVPCADPRFSVVIVAAAATAPAAAAAAALNKDNAIHPGHGPQQQQHPPPTLENQSIAYSRNTTLPVNNKLNISSVLGSDVFEISKIGNVNPIVRPAKP